MAAFNVILGCVMALLVILFTISSIARYYIKFTLFTVLSLIFATAPLPLMFIKPFDPRNALIPAALLRFSARVLGLRWTVRGTENVDDSRGAVVLLNHQSALDLYVLAVLWPLMERCAVVSKRSLQYLVPFGTATWMWGTVFIDRGAQSAWATLNKQAEAVRDHKGINECLKPGYRHPRSSTQPDGMQMRCPFPPPPIRPPVTQTPHETRQ